jgi:predicted phage terminase large subunit-like protein
MPNEIRAQPGPQERFLSCSADVAFYGGAAGGGKTFALLLNPLYHVDNGKFGCVTFRRTTKQVTSEGGLWDTASDLYAGIGAKGNQQYLTWKFQSGAKVGFAHMELEKNRFDWQGAQIPLIQFDELTHFTWRQFIYMLSRNRSVSGIPGRIRATLNPDPDHWARRFIDWWIDDKGFAVPERSGVVRYFIVVGDDVLWSESPEDLQEKHPGSLPKSFTFIKSSLSDNKILMEADPRYLANLQALTRVERARLLDGNWNIRPTAGMFFRRSDFEIVEAAPPCVKWVRAWDQAGTKKVSESHSPDWTAGVKMGRTADGRYVIAHVERFQENPPTVDRKIKNTADMDGKPVTVRLAQDPGQAGKSQARAQTAMLAGRSVKSKPVTGDKETRAKPLASQVEAGNVLIVRGSWNEAFLSEMENFPEGANDDQVDAAADAFDELVAPAIAKGSTKSLMGMY